MASEQPKNRIPAINIRIKIILNGMEFRITDNFSNSQLWKCGIDNKSFPKKRKYWWIDFTDCTQIGAVVTNKIQL